MNANSLVLAPEGDVILVVGRERFRIHADSLFLKRHSTVFAALLGSNFREGQDLNTSSSKEIPLPDDDPYAMAVICATMYHDFGHIPRSPATKLVYGWLKSDHLTLGKDLANILAVSYMVRDQEAFKNVSRALVSKYEGSFADLADSVICDVLPWKTFCRLEELRTRIQTLAISVALGPSVDKPIGFGYDKHSGCSQLAGRVQENFSRDLLIEARQRKERIHRERSYKTSLHSSATGQSAVGPLLTNLQELAKTCNKCRESVETSQLSTFCLSLAGNDLRQVAMLPEWYWGSKLTY
ncbi:hypothetical protein COCVIDRAFT_42147 [Bipolaris victoriae FI3]|uniref:BTB domain-containing protein n=1 Tax=Bipolaris victoriae (strain FI3) TaxID=930091 RepID=W7DV30_BIPV3|nr:hypothetical protein COCVIDRAFT_42147 [Bipolaris victoriae FI3]